MPDYFDSARATNRPLDLSYGYALAGMADRGPRYGYDTFCANEIGETPRDTTIGHWTQQLWTRIPFRVEDLLEACDGSGASQGDFDMSTMAKAIIVHIRKPYKT